MPARKVLSIRPLREMFSLRALLLELGEEIVFDADGDAHGEVITS
jgi:hypothetical protein